MMFFQIDNVNEEIQITQKNHKIKASRTEKNYFYTYKTSLVDQQWFSEPKEIISKHKGKLVNIVQLEKQKKRLNQN